jgi:hypothetical protein
VAGRFALFVDEHVHGPLVEGLTRLGWDVERAVDAFGQRTDDDRLFAYAAEKGRVFVTNDEPAEAIAIRWLAVGQPFRGLICWVQEHQRRMTVGDLIKAFEELAAKDDPFQPYPIVHIRPKP